MRLRPVPVPPDHDRPAVLDRAAAARRARKALLGLYLLLGLAFSSWLARLPAVRTALDLTEAELGVVLLLGAVGSLLTVLVAGGITSRFGSRRTIVASAVVYSVSVLALGGGPTVGSVVLLVAGVFAMSASFALGNVPMNVETVVVERAMGRTVVPQFHAAFSVGALLGSLVGALCAWAEVPLMVQMTVTGVVTLVWRLAAVPVAVLPRDPDAAPPSRTGMRSSLGAWRERRTLLIGVVVMTAALSEGSANNWLAIAVVDGFASTEAVAAVVFGAFTGSMMLARLCGTWLIDRFGPVRVLAGSGVSAFVGLMLFGLAPNLPLAALGVVGWGLGAGLVIPIGMAAVSHEPLAAAGRVAVVSAFASVASLTAPPLLGAVAATTGARHALMLVAVGLAASVVLARAVRRPDQDAVDDASTGPGHGHDPGAGPATPSVPVPEPATLPEPAPVPGRAARDGDAGGRVLVTSAAATDTMVP